MGVKDAGIEWNKGRKIIQAIDFASQWVGSPLTGQGAGTPVYGASGVAAAELTGILVGGAGDELYHMMPVPWNMDPAIDPWIRLIFSHDSTDADTPDFLCDFTWGAKQAALVDAGASPDATATIAAHTCSTTSGSLERTLWARAGGLGDAWTAEDIALLLSVEFNGLGSASADEIVFHWAELAYTISATGDSGQRDTTDFDPED